MLVSALWPATPAAAQDAGRGISGYADRVMANPSPAWDDEADAAAAYDPTGLPRGLRFEARASASNSEFGPTRSGALSVRGAWDTLNHGSFSLDGSARLWDQAAGVRDRGGVSLSLQQRGMPFGGGWSASNGVGVIQTLSPVSPLWPSAVLVPSRLMQGVATQWQNTGQGLTLQFSAGETGAFQSVGQGAFQGSGNAVLGWGLGVQGGAAGGASVLPPGWRYSAWGARASGGTATLRSAWGVMQPEPASLGVLQTVAWASSGVQAQGQWLQSRSADSAPAGTALGTRATRTGLWLDASSAASSGSGPVGGGVHRWGLHRLDPDLTWQGAAVSSNALGAYYRWSGSGLRTRVEAQLGSSRPLNRALGGITVLQAGVSLRHTLSSQLDVGGLLQFLGGSSSATQLTGYADARRPWGSVRWQSGLETTAGQLALLHATSDQSWGLPEGWRLSSSQAWSTARRSALTALAPDGGWARTLELGAAGGSDLGATVSLDVAARASLPLADASRAGLYQVSANGQWRFAPGWSLGLSLARSRSSGLVQPVPASPLPSLPGSYLPTSYAGHSARDLWLSLRYDFQAGTALLPLGAGARLGGGSGAIEGVVFLDDNGNGHLDARESRAPDITVVLDGRYSTRTDAQGRYEFAFVASGPHSVQVASDTLPLPWAMPSPDASGVLVQPRDTARTDFGAQRDRVGGPVSPGRP